MTSPYLTTPLRSEEEVREERLSAAEEVEARKAAYERELLARIWELCAPGAGLK